MTPLPPLQMSHKINALIGPRALNEGKPMNDIVEKLRSPAHPEPIDPKAVYRTRDTAIFEEAAAEITRLSAEVAALRASLGEPTGAEPAGCPCPGACSATALQARVRGLEEGLAECRDQFNDYAEQHRAKGTAEGDRKAATNEAFAEMCRSLLFPDQQGGRGEQQ